MEGHANMGEMAIKFPNTASCAVEIWHQTLRFSSAQEGLQNKYIAACNNWTCGVVMQSYGMQLA